MNVKGIFVVFVLLVAVFATVNVISAGWFDNNVVADDFQFAPITNYSYYTDIYDGVRLASDESLSNTIVVRESNKENFTKLIESESPANLIYSSFLNGKQMDHPFEKIKSVNESNIHIIVEKNNAGPSVSVTTGLFEKDGFYYHVHIRHHYDPDLVDDDIQIVKDIQQSLERKHSNKYFF